LLERDLSCICIERGGWKPVATPKPRRAGASATPRPRRCRSYGRFVGVVTVDKLAVLHLRVPVGDLRLVEGVEDIHAQFRRDCGAASDLAREREIGLMNEAALEVAVARLEAVAAHLRAREAGRVNCRSRSLEQPEPMSPTIRTRGVKSGEPVMFTLLMPVMLDVTE
jgi:hypothetical protein